MTGDSYREMLSISFHAGSWRLNGSVSSLRQKNDKESSENEDNDIEKDVVDEYSAQKWGLMDELWFVGIMEWSRAG